MYSTYLCDVHLAFIDGQPVFQQLNLCIFLLYGHLSAPALGMIVL